MSSLYERNRGYVSATVQSRLAETRVLIAGCGIGSAVAEPFLRLGIQKMVLVDGDHVTHHNLNRQNFVAADVGAPKVEALARRLRAIAPEAEIVEQPIFLSEANAHELVARADVVFDTIDFVDLPAIVALHDAARAQGKPVFSALAAGWGAAAVYFDPAGPVTVRDVLDLPRTGSVANESFAERYGAFVGRLAPRLEPVIVDVMATTLRTMADGTPCPAPAVSAGAAAVGALATTLLFQWAAGEPIATAPDVILTNLLEVCRPVRG
jgi:molybdopterin/thiamine biosynthesis adenylyltransferase